MKSASSAVSTINLIIVLLIALILLSDNDIRKTEAKSLGLPSTQLQLKLQKISVASLAKLSGETRQTKLGNSTTKQVGTTSDTEKQSLLKVALHKNEKDQLAKSYYKDYLTDILRLEKEQIKRGATVKVLSRRRRSKIKKIIAKIILKVLLIVKVAIKYFFIVAKKAAIIAG